jgi:hypothetical protein
MQSIGSQIHIQTWLDLDDKKNLLGKGMSTRVGEESVPRACV